MKNILAFLIISLAFAVSSSALKLSTPYLQNMTSNAVTIMYQTDASATSRVEYWTVDSVKPMTERQLFGGQEVVHSPEHRVRLTGLTPATTYRYRVVAREILKNRAYSKTFADEEVSSLVYSFTTPPIRPEDFTILIFNDLHSNRETIQRLAKMARATPHNMIIFNGDCLSEPSDREHAIAEIAFLADAFDLHSVPAVFVRGNHEIRNAYSSGMPTLFDRFDGKTYGAMTFGDTRLVFLDCGEDKPDSTRVYYGLNDFTRLREEQADFIKTELKSREFRKARHRVLIHHIPIWGNTDKYQPCTELWAPLLADAKFDFDITGHNHKTAYMEPEKGQHNFPVIIGGGPKPSTASMIAVNRRGSSLTVEMLPLTSFKPVTLDAIEISGELGERIDRNFERMESELYHPENVYWSEEASGGWPGDKEGRTILALTLDSRATHRPAKYLDTLIYMLPKRLNERAYLGTIHSEADEQQLSGHGWLLRGLCEYHEATGDTTTIGLADGIVDGLFLPISDKLDFYPLTPALRGGGDMSGEINATVPGWRLSSDIGCLFIGMEGLIHYYKHRQRPEVKSLIDKLITLFLRLDLVEIKAQTHATLTALRGLMRYSKITGDKSLLPEIERRWHLYKAEGMTENYENYNWFGRFDTWTEPCAIIDSYLLAVQLWQETRNPEYLADAEHIYYNGICATQRENGGFGCNKPAGRVYDTLSEHCHEAHWCCTMRGGEGLPRVAESSYFTSGDTIFVPFYRESSLRMPNLAITQHTDYPFGNSIEININEAPVGSTIALAAPEYISIDTLTLNNKPLSISAENGFIHLSASKGDTITMNYTLKEFKTPLSFDTSKYKVEKGPLIFGENAEGNMIPVYNLMQTNPENKKVIF